ncbi:hypothetical protein COL48_26860 [Bacillus toyonensis]|uniref:Uncharacterized protein n=1 Tax=Bacillus toyonensis TaxID=155322 RepID=A0AAP8JZ90_9BACI|nr:hypothetical protein CON81_25090 [Bacillus toyonensis]PEE79899.1 hypothetical protein COO15_26210 [Bacillus toyonensis]PFX70409.1 hypothetical protein COL35_02630 [Bacillus toyonensis]PFY29147.1 hypothetical protein COL48_26860 [Bacillus toyonensis]PGD15130.1 hypothetical protein COM35_16965 [Bacillus toyonensis]
MHKFNPFLVQNYVIRDLIDEIQINNLSSIFKKQAVILIYLMFILKEMHVILFKYLEFIRK